jgi:FkbM family methyltransferase
MTAGLRPAIRRVGFRWYHALCALNYERELFARTVSTPAGDVRTYELADTHSDDFLLGAIDANAAEDAVIYDVGAYVGEYALALAATQSRTVVGVEPSRTHCDRFQKNRAASKPAGTVHLEHAGLGAVDGTRQFYHSSFPKLSSFDRDHATRWGAAVVETSTVPVRTLDSLVGDYPPPDHLKMDVEGHAHAVLRGATDTLERHQPVLYIEPHDSTDTVREWCTEHEYTVRERADGLVCHPPSVDVTLPAVASS